MDKRSLVGINSISAAIGHHLNAMAYLSTVVADYAHPFTGQVICSYLLMETSSRITHNVTKHVISSWFHKHDNEFSALKLLPQSPELNPIKHLRAEQEIAA